MIARTHVKFGFGVLVDCHSMPGNIRIAGIGGEAVAAARQIDALLHARPVDIISRRVDGEAVVGQG